MGRPIISYNVCANGELNIYYNQRILCSVSGCSNMNSSQIENLIKEILTEQGYTWNEDGTIDRVA